MGFEIVGLAEIDDKEHHDGQVSLQGAAGLALGLALGLLAGDVGTAGRIVARLNEGDPVEGGVELAVAAAVQAMVP